MQSNYFMEAQKEIYRVAYSGWGNVYHVGRHQIILSPIPGLRCPSNFYVVQQKHVHLISILYAYNQSYAMTEVWSSVMLLNFLLSQVMCLYVKDVMLKLSDKKIFDGG
jgi:hypothetical protein